MLQKIEKNKEDLVDLILNPHVHAIEDTLKEIYSDCSIDRKNQLIDELTLIFTKDDILYNAKIQAKFPDLINLLKEQDLYNNTCVLLSDIVRHKPVIQDIFYLLKIFDYINFDNYNPTISLIFSMCYGNKKLTDFYFEKIYQEDRDGNNDLIKILADN